MTDHADIKASTREMIAADLGSFSLLVQWWRVVDRYQMLDERSRMQRSRLGTGRTTGVPAWMYRRTGKPHKNARAKARRLRQVAMRTSTDRPWLRAQLQGTP